MNQQTNEQQLTKATNWKIKQVKFNCFSKQFWFKKQISQAVWHLVGFFGCFWIGLFLLNITFYFANAQKLIFFTPNWNHLLKNGFLYHNVFYGIWATLYLLLFLTNLFAWIILWSYWFIKKHLKAVDVVALKNQYQEINQWTFNEHKKIGSIKNFSKLFKTDLSSSGWVLKTEFNSQNQQIKYYMLPQKSGIVLGTIGSGKSQKINIPTLMANANVNYQNKASFCVTDPKGELFKATASYMSKNGYQVYVLNFRDPNITHFWNPLDYVWEYYQNFIQYENEYLNQKEKLSSLRKTIIDYCSKAKIKFSLTILFKTSETKNNNERTKILNQNYKLEQQMKQYEYAEKTLAAVQTKMNHFQTLYTKEINLIAEKIISKNYESKDPYWDNMATKILVATIQFYLLNPNIKKTDFNLFNICSSLNDEKQLVEYINQLDPDLKPVNEAKPIVNASEQTRSSIFSSVASHTSLLTDNTLKVMLSNNSFDLRNFCKKPTIIFLITPDDQSLYNKLIEIFIQQLYQTLTYLADNVAPLERPFYFLLEEFGNIAKIPDFRKMIGVSRSRNIHYLLTLQDLSQLDEIYGKNESKIIQNQCGLMVFLNSKDEETKKRIAELMGSKWTIEASGRNFDVNKNAVINFQINQAINKQTLMNVEEITKIDENSAIILFNNKNPSYIKTKLAYQIYERLQFQTTYNQPLDLNLANQMLSALNQKTKYLWNSFELGIFQVNWNKLKTFVELQANFLGVYDCWQLEQLLFYCEKKFNLIDLNSNNGQKWLKMRDEQIGWLSRLIQTKIYDNILKIHKMNWGSIYDQEAAINVILKNYQIIFSGINDFYGQLIKNIQQQIVNQTNAKQFIGYLGTNDGMKIQTNLPTIRTLLCIFKTPKQSEFVNTLNLLLQAQIENWNNDEEEQIRLNNKEINNKKDFAIKFWNELLQVLDWFYQIFNISFNKRKGNYDDCWNPSNLLEVKNLKAKYQNWMQLIQLKNQLINNRKDA